MAKTQFTLKARVWLYSGKSGWHFVTLPKSASTAIRKSFGPVSRAWGSLPVTAKVGKSQWGTSIFPDKKAGAYLLPLRADVRKQEEIFEGDTITFTLNVHCP